MFEDADSSKVDQFGFESDLEFSSIVRIENVPLYVFKGVRPVWCKMTSIVMQNHPAPPSPITRGSWSMHMD